MKTIRQMSESGELKRNNTYRAHIDDLHEEPGFNLRIEDADFAAGIEDFAVYLKRGGIYPPLEVRPRVEGGLWIVDGHRRRKAIKRAIELGAPLHDKDGKVYVSITPFEGNDADRTLRVMTSAEGRGLQPLEMAMGCKRLRGMGWDVARIAEEWGKSRSRVEQLLLLADSNSDVQKMVSEGKVSATLAIDTVRQHGEQAGAVIAKAVPAGGGKVTPKSMRSDRKFAAGRELWESLPPNAMKAEIGMVTVDVVLLRELLKAVKAI